MSGFLVLFLPAAILFPLLLYVFVEREIADPTDRDDAEAERVAQERGGRQSDGGDTSDAEGRNRDDRQ